jgi:hypothetical protein
LKKERRRKGGRWLGEQQVEGSRKGKKGTRAVFFLGAKSSRESPL